MSGGFRRIPATRSALMTSVTLFALLLAACGGPAPTTTSPTTPAASEAPTEVAADPAPTENAPAAPTTAPEVTPAPTGPAAATSAPEASAEPPSGDGTTAVSYPLTIKDATDQEFTFDAPPKLGCTWYGCFEAMADIGVPLYTADMDEDTAKSVFYSPAGPPTNTITDGSNPELWAATEVDLILTRVPASSDMDALETAAPIFYLHHPSYGESSQTGYQAYVEDLRLLGQLSNHPTEAEAAIERFNTALDNLRNLSTPETKALNIAVLFSGEGYGIIGPENPFCAAVKEVGLGTCIGDGVANWEVSAESFLSADPDWIVYQAGDSSYKDRSDAVWPQLTAVKEGHVYDAEGHRYYCCSLRGLIHALQEYTSHVLPDAGIPAPGPVEVFDPTTSPLLKKQ